MSLYLLDTNVFIEAKKRHYGFDIVSAFWEWLIQDNQAGKVASIEAVLLELKSKKDELSNWAQERGNGFFLRQDIATIRARTDVSNWAFTQDYTERARAKFLTVADHKLVAHALAQKSVVVTHEVRDDNARNRVKIPNACMAFGVEWMDPYEMLRREEAKFILA